VGLRCQSYRPSFWVAAVGMMVAQVTFALGRKHLVESPTPARGADVRKPEAGRDDRARLLALVGLFLAAIFFWTAFYQNGFALTLFAEQSTRSYRLLRPETYQFFEPAFILVFTPLMLLGLARLARRGRELSTPAKILGGMLVMAVSVLVMALASHLGGNLDQPILSPLWLVGSYALVTLAEILISPMGQSYVSRVAPPRYRGFMMGGWFASTALGSYLSGSIGGFYARMPHDIYYLLITGLLLVSAALTLLMYRTLKRY
jgi:proton-dependent oligopeptide transporter, POT family